MVKIFLFFLDFGRGYLRVWPTLFRPVGYEGQARLRSSSYGVAGSSLLTMFPSHCPKL
jgi:hypothetical protein